MISLEQVQALESRVEKALGAIERLTSENAALRESTAREKKRTVELERTIEDFRRDQAKIEQGILHALERLNVFEDAILDGAPGAGVKTNQPRASSTTAAAKPAAPESASTPKDGANPEPGTAGAELEIF